MNFKKGDRVALYNNGVRSLCTVKHVNDHGSLILNDANGNCICSNEGFAKLFHPKQCRRLKKKKKRRVVWVNHGVFGNQEMSGMRLIDPEKPGWSKFVEEWEEDWEE